MDNNISIQQNFFSIIKRLNHPHISFVHSISELLGISYDSAYRRIRGDKPLVLEELMILSAHFHISIDQLLNFNFTKVHFEPISFGQTQESFLNWLDFMLKELRLVQSSSRKDVIYSARDLPIFYYFDFPDLIAFKFFLWQRMLVDSNTASEPLFDASCSIKPELADIGNRILSTYVLTPSTELWNFETFNGILHQLEYAWFSGFFMDKDSALQLCKSLDTFFHHMQKQVSMGVKYRLGSDPSGRELNYNVYLSEIFLSDNMVLIGTDHTKCTIIAYTTLNLLKTDDPSFYQLVGHSWRTLMNSATLISTTSAKERNHFFTMLHDRMLRLEDLIRQSSI